MGISANCRALPGGPGTEIRDSGAVWYAADHDRVSVLLKFASDNRHLFLPAGSLREADSALAYAEKLLVRMSPRWLIGCRKRHGQY